MVLHQIKWVINYQLAAQVLSFQATTGKLALKPQYSLYIRHHGGHLNVHRLQKNMLHCDDAQGIACDDKPIEVSGSCRTDVTRSNT